MFPYRRQGPKKRSKNGPNRRPRGPQKPLPNSARELLPLIQPATKALAQVLAGRASASGQFGHAQAVAAQAERLIAERAHNRLNPAEREEFFEQLARLKLTLVDAELEAGVQADEEEAKPAPRPPVAQERLKQMALALTTPDPARADVKPDAAEKEAELEDAAPGPGQVHDAWRPGDEELEEAQNEPRPESRSIGNAQSGRLQLSRSAAERAASAVATAPGTRARPARAARRSRAEPAETPGEPGDEAGEQARGAIGPGGGASETPSEPRPGEAAAAGNGQRSAQRARRATQKGVPEGWVIDDEGYVVPGP